MVDTPLTWAGGFGHYGTKQGVIVQGSEVGVAWPGLTGVTIEYDGGDVNATPADDQSAWITTSASKSLTPTINALDYPDALASLMGEASLSGNDSATAIYDLQTPTTGSFMFVTQRMGRGANDGEQKQDIIIMYNLRFAPSSRKLTTGSDDMVEFEFPATSSPIEFTVDGKTKSTSMLTIKAEDAKFDKAMADLQAGKLITPDIYLAYATPSGK